MLCISYQRWIHQSSINQGKSRPSQRAGGAQGGCSGLLCLKGSWGRMLCRLRLRDRDKLVLAQFVPAVPVCLRGVTTIGPGVQFILSAPWLSRAAQLLVQVLRTSLVRRRWYRGSRQCPCSGSKPLPCWRTCRTCFSQQPGGTAPGWSPVLSYSYQAARRRWFRSWTQESDSSGETLERGLCCI